MHQRQRFTQRLIAGWLLVALRSPAARWRPPGRPPAVLSLGVIASLSLLFVGARLPWAADVEKNHGRPALPTPAAFALRQNQDPAARAVAAALRPATPSGLEEGETTGHYGPVAPGEELSRRTDRFPAQYLAVRSLYHRGTAGDLDVTLGEIAFDIARLATATGTSLYPAPAESEEAIRRFHDLRAEASRQWEAQAAPEPIPVSRERSLDLLMHQLAHALDDLDDTLISGTIFPRALRTLIEVPPAVSQQSSRDLLAKLTDYITTTRAFLRDRIALADGENPKGATASFADIKDQFAQRYGARVVMGVAPEAEAAQVAMTPVRLFSLINNLVNDAVKHSPADAEVRVQMEIVSGGELKIIVSDQGEGIPPDYFTRTGNGMIRLFTLEGRGGRVPIGMPEVWETVGIAGGRLAVETLREDKWKEARPESIGEGDLSFSEGARSIVQEFSFEIEQHLEQWSRLVAEFEAKAAVPSKETIATLIEKRNRLKNRIGQRYISQGLDSDAAWTSHLLGTPTHTVSGLFQFLRKDPSNKEDIRVLLQAKEEIRRIQGFFHRVAEGRRVEPGTTFTVWLPLAPAAGLEESHDWPAAKSFLEQLPALALEIVARPTEHQAQQAYKAQWALLQPTLQRLVTQLFAAQPVPGVLLQRATPSFAKEWTKRLKGHQRVENGPILLDLQGQVYAVVGRSPTNGDWLLLDLAHPWDAKSQATVYHSVSPQTTLKERYVVLAASASPRARRAGLEEPAGDDLKARFGRVLALFYEAQETGNPETFKRVILDGLALFEYWAPKKEVPFSAWYDAYQVLLSARQALAGEMPEEHWDEGDLLTTSGPHPAGHEVVEEPVTPAITEALWEIPVGSADRDQQVRVWLSTELALYRDRHLGDNPSKILRRRWFPDEAVDRVARYHRRDWWADSEDRQRVLADDDQARRLLAVANLLETALWGDDAEATNPVIRHRIQAVLRADVLQAERDQDAAAAARAYGLFQTVVAADDALQFQFAQLIHDSGNTEWLDTVTRLLGEWFSGPGRQRLLGYLGEPRLLATATALETQLAEAPKSAGLRRQLADSYTLLSQSYSDRDNGKAMTKAYVCRADCQRIVARWLDYPRPGFFRRILRMLGIWKPPMEPMDLYGQLMLELDEWVTHYRRQFFLSPQPHEVDMSDMDPLILDMWEVVFRTKAELAGLAGHAEEAERFLREAATQAQLRRRPPPRVKPSEGPPSESGEAAGLEESNKYQAAALAQARAVGRELRDGAMGQALRHLIQAMDVKLTAGHREVPLSEWQDLMNEADSHAVGILKQLEQAPGYAAQALDDTLTHELKRDMSNLWAIVDRASEEIMDLTKARDYGMQILSVLDELASLSRWREWYMMKDDVMLRDIHGIVLETSEHWRWNHQHLKQFEQAVAEFTEQVDPARAGQMGWIIPFSLAKRAGMDRVVAAMQQAAGPLLIAFVAETEFQREGLLLAGISETQIHSTVAAAAEALSRQVGQVILIADDAGWEHPDDVTIVALQQFLEQFSDQLTRLGLVIPSAVAMQLRDAIRQHAGLEQSV